jgi:hypothetical protein
MAGHSGNVRPGLDFSAIEFRKQPNTPLKMASDRKMFNMKVVRLVKTVKIAFGHISIRGRLLPQK